MALKPGTQLGTCEILALIGAGGMGEVYKARDAKLNRLVAVKVLPPSLAENRDFLARFEREARAVAALSHPNVLGIFDLGSQDGLTYAVMELLEGDSLRDRLKNGALPPKRAMEIAQELAQGLGAAHDKGIVHRDIKPENIFLTRDGRVKILDFGLAKQGAAPRSGTANLATEALSLLPNATEAGLVLGTAGYMSPEQVRGESADHRADIFAFGVVLFEMLSGERPFRGESSVQTMTAILEQDPPALTASRGPLPPALERLVAHCLEKHAEARFQSMKDIAFALQNLSTLATDGAGRVPAVRPKRLPPLALGLGAAAVLVLGGLAWAFRLPPFSVPAQPSFTRVTNTPGTVETAFFGPDGRTVYFSERIQGSMPELFVLNPGVAEPRPLGVKNALLMGVSPEGELAILRNPENDYGSLLRGMLAKVGGGGGAVREVREHVVQAAWDGPGFATVVDPDKIHLRLEFGGKVVREANATLVVMRLLRCSPDGRALALAEGDGITRAEIVTYDRQGKRTVHYAKAGDGNGDTLTGLAWGPDGKLWFSELLGDQTALWSLSPKGSRRLLWRGAGNQALLDVSREGRILLADQQSRRGVLVQKAGEAVARDVSIANGTEAYGFTPDGRALVLLESPVMDGGTAQDTTYLWTPEGGPATKVGKGNPWSLSADGRWVSVGYAGFEPKDLDSSVLASLQDAGLDPKAVLDPVTPAPSLTFSPTGAGLPFAVALPRTFENAGYAFLTRDDQSAIFQAQDHGTPRWYLVDRKGGAPRRLTADGYGVAFSGLSALSPDGTRLIVGGDGTFAIQALAGGDPQPVKGLVGSERPIGWCQDQTAVFTRTMTLPIVVNRLDLATGTRRPVFTYNPGDASGLLRIRNVETTPSGSVFALS